MNSKQEQRKNAKLIYPYPWMVLKFAYAKRKTYKDKILLGKKSI